MNAQKVVTLEGKRRAFYNEIIEAVRRKNRQKRRHEAKQAACRSVTG